MAPRVARSRACRVYAALLLEMLLLNNVRFHFSLETRSLTLPFGGYSESPDIRISRAFFPSKEFMLRTRTEVYVMCLRGRYRNARAKSKFVSCCNAEASAVWCIAYFQDDAGFLVLVKFS